MLAMGPVQARYSRQVMEGDLHIPYSPQEEDRAGEQRDIGRMQPRPHAGRNDILVLPEFREHCMHWVLYVLMRECQATAGLAIYHTRPIGQVSTSREGAGFSSCTYTGPLRVSTMSSWDRVPLLVRAKEDRVPLGVVRPSSRQ